MKRAPFIGAAVIVAAGWSAAGTAQAATVELARAGNIVELRVRDSAGERNRIIVRQTDRGAYEVVDKAAELTAGRRCHQVGDSGSRVRCPVTFRAFDRYVDIDTAGGNDAVRSLLDNDRRHPFAVTSGIPAEPAFEPAFQIVLGEGADSFIGGPAQEYVSGGSGPDVIRSGDGADVIIAEAGPDGNDSIFGGDARDFVSYADRLDPITANLDSGIVRTVGERDSLDEVEGVVGSAGDDRLLGTSGPDAFIGGDGADLVLAGPGGDRIAGGQGGDRLRGEDGRDRLAGGENHDLIIAGPDHDLVIGADDKVADRIECGSGDDQAIVGKSDDRRRKCERVSVFPDVFPHTDLIIFSRG